MNYPHLTAGYRGQRVQRATLNSTYWARFAAADLDDPSLVMPQRIPRPDFFKELLGHETSSNARAFRKRVDRLSNMHRALLKASSRDDRFTLRLFNLERALLRFGRFEQVARRPLPRAGDADLRLRLATLAISARIYGRHGQNPSREIAALRKLWRGSSRASATPRMELAIRLIVCSSRYSKSGVLREQVAYLLEQAFREPRPASLPDQIILAMALRALPMAPELSASQSARCFARMNRVLDTLPVRNERERLVRRELLFTTFQTLSKWESGRKRPAAAERHLRRMVALDPLDSTAHSELGLALFYKSRFGEARRSFDRALRLGPPGLALNAYFRGLCEVAIKRDAQAMASYWLSAKLDPTALSPLLSLHELQKGKHRRQARATARKILASSTLRGQLDASERAELRAFLRSSK